MPLPDKMHWVGVQKLSFTCTELAESDAQNQASALSSKERSAGYQCKRLLTFIISPLAFAFWHGSE